MELPLINRTSRAAWFIHGAALAFMLALAVWLGNTFFAANTFHLNGMKYTAASESGDGLIRYTSFTGPEVQVRTDTEGKTVTVMNEEFRISEPSGEYPISYQVTYPQGHFYRVESSNGMILGYDQNGELVPPISVYADYGFRTERILQEGEELYNPTSLVIAAYPQYHTNQGSLILFLLAIAIFIYGYCGLRFQRFQKLMFFLSFHWLWVEEAEPSEFYYLTCKIAGIVFMIGSVCLAVYSFIV